ncbi:hypothetical protein AAVH_36493, partial [Aphelenchoides avenae]
MRELMKKMVDAEQQVIEANQREDDLRRKLEDAQQRIDKAAEMIKRLQDEMDELSERSQAQSVQVQSERDQLRERIVILEADLHGSQQVLEQKENELKKLQDELQNVEGRLTEEASKRSTAEVHLKAAKEKLEQREIDEHRTGSTFRELQTLVEDLRRAESRCKQEKERMAADIAELHKELDGWRQRCSDLQAKFAESERQCALKEDQLRRMEAKLEVAETWKEAMKSDEAKQQERYHALEMELEGLRRELEAESRRRQDLEHQMQAVHSERETLAVTLQHTTAEYQRRTTLSDSAHNDLLRSFQRLQVENKSLTEQHRNDIDVLSGKLRTAEGKFEVAEDRLAASQRREKDLSERLVHYEHLAQRALSAATTSTSLHPPFAGVSGSFGDLHGTLDSGGADLGELEAEERPVSSTIAAGGERSVVGNVSDSVLYPSGTSHDGGSAIEVAFHRFRERIRHLEREN